MRIEAPLTTEPKPTFIALATIMLALVCVVHLPAPVQAEPVPVSLRAAILFRALGYERGLQDGSGPVRIAVLVSDSDDGEDMVEALEALAERTELADRPVRITSIEFENVRQANAAVEEAGAQVVYASQGLENKLRRLGESLEESQRLLLCADGESVGRGCMLGVERDGERSRIVVDVPRARAAGASFDSRLLSLSRVVR